MNIALLAECSSIHTIRWANALSDKGHEVDLITMGHEHDGLSGAVNVHRLMIPKPFGYWLNAPEVRRFLKRRRPNVLHAHYAAGYGVLGRLAGYHPYILSVWGSDVLIVPNRSRWHARKIRQNLSAADWICSTSHAMAERTNDLRASSEKICVIPFGIDLDEFHSSPGNDPLHPSEHDKFTIGTVKTLKHIYGIDILIRGFAIFHGLLLIENEENALKLRLRITGDGPERSSLERLTRELGIHDVTVFTGKVAHSDVSRQLRELDVYVAVSRSESFGVSVLEACACCVPVVVSDVGGLPEIISDGENGIVVPPASPEALAEALKALFDDEKLLMRLANQGRRNVAANYNWTKNVRSMEHVYFDIVRKFEAGNEFGHLGS